jgi:hypothetical protein
MKIVLLLFIMMHNQQKCVKDIWDKNIFEVEPSPLVHKIRNHIWQAIPLHYILIRPMIS